jgi:hypothetical protein
MYNRRKILRGLGIGTTAIGINVTGLSLSAAAAESTTIGEAGTIQVDASDSNDWYRAPLDQPYSDPVVILKPLSHNGGQPAHVRLREVSSDYFEFKIEEWRYLDGSHIAERMNYFVMEAGTHTLPDGTAIEVGNLGADEDFAQVRFAQSFGSQPVVFSQSQTYNGGDEIVTRNRNISADEFEVRVQEAQGDDGGHTNETIGYIAAEPIATDGFEIGRARDGVTHEWYRVDFDQRHEYDDGRVLLADLQTFHGPNTAGLRYQDLDSSGVDISVEEERSSDSEMYHTSEEVGYLVAPRGNLSSEDDDGSDVETMFHLDFEDSGYEDTFTDSWKFHDTYENRHYRSTDHAHSGDWSLEVEFPEDEHYGCNAQYEPDVAGHVDEKPEEMWASYWVYFQEGFQSGSNLYKMPGMSDLNGLSPANGKPNATDNHRWHAPGTFTDANGDSVETGYYVYYLDMTGDWGDLFSAGRVPTGEWHRIDQHFVMNSYDGDGGSLSDANYDGIMQMWVDGDLKVDEQGMRFRASDELAIDHWRFLLYYGGADTSLQEQSIWIDDIRVNTDKFNNL